MVRQFGPRVNADDAGTLSDIWNVMFPAFTPPVGWYVDPPGFLGVTGAATVRQRLNITPFLIGKAGWTCDSASINVSTAASSAALLDVGLYGGDGTGFPKGANQLGAVTFSAVTTTGFKTASWPTPIVLTPGLYWMITRYDYSSAPTTAPQFSCLNNTAWQMPSPGLTLPAIRSYIVTGATVLPTTAISTASLSISGNTDAPWVKLHRSA